MNRRTAILALLLCAACYSGDPSVGKCTADTDCVNLSDGGTLPGAFCNSKQQCEYACDHICGLAESCVNAVCELQGPKITQVNAPTTWSLISQNVTVTAVADDTGGPGLASATLRIAGKPDIQGTTTDTGLVRTYTFTVPGSVQTTGSEAPVNFTVIAADTAGGVTPDRAAGAGQLRIDDLGPSLAAGVTVNGGVPAGPAPQIKWFAQNQTANIDAQVTIRDDGSGVDTTSLTLVQDGTSTRLDTGTPSCTTQTAQTQLCHFSIPPATPIVPAGEQRRVSFNVAGKDVAGNPVRTNVAALGIDGKPPTVTFTIGNAGDTTKTANYPAAFADCNGGTADGTMYCGHDGSHFWRAGDGKYTVAFTVSDVFPDPNSSGSGVDQAGGTCTIAGSSTACVATFNAAGSNATTSQFTFPANFATATFSSGDDGSGSVSVTVNARDAVGNTPTVGVTIPVSVTRLKWMRSMATKVDTFKGSPIATSLPIPQTIFAGSERDALGPLVSLSPDGSVLWRAGHGDVTTISNNVAYSSTTRRLYVAEDSASKLVVYGIATDGVTGSYNCVLNDGTTAGSAVGAPVLFAGATERAIVSDNVGRLWSLAGTPGAGCATVGNSFTNNGGAWTSLNPPTTNGTLVFVAHDVTKLSSIAFNGSAFGAVTDAASFTVSIFGPVSVAGSIFFGNRSVPADLFSYTAAFSLNWTTSTTASGSLADGLNAPVVVGPSYAFASPLTGDGQLHAYNKATGAHAWRWDTGAVKAGNISAPSFGADATIYFGTSSPAQLIPLKVTAGTPDVPSLANNWTAAYKGSTLQLTLGVVTPPAIPATNTVVDGLPTEPVIDSNGVLYFATGGSKVYALMTDSGGPLAPVAGSTWPRVGYDNCNSSNTGFNCQ